LVPVRDKSTRTQCQHIKLMMPGPTHEKNPFKNQQ
jgi:hypothetical protein